MVPGFNHNIQRNGKVFHIQTEDSGLTNPHIITLLYLDGTIIGKKKTSYADLVTMDNLPSVVRQLMEEQHKGMLRELIRGGFDQPTPEIIGTAVAPAAPAVPAAPVPAPVAQAQAPMIQPTDIGSLFGGGGDEGEKSLDEIILSYLSDEGT